MYSGEVGLEHSVGQDLRSHGIAYGVASLQELVKYIRVDEPRDISHQDGSFLRYHCGLTMGVKVMFALLIVPKKDVYKLILPSYEKGKKPSVETDRH